MNQEIQAADDRADPPIVQPGGAPDSQTIQVFSPELTDLQCQVLNLLGVPQEVFRPH